MNVNKAMRELFYFDVQFKILWWEKADNSMVPLPEWCDITCFSSVYWYFFIAKSEKTQSPAKQEDLYFGIVLLNLTDEGPLENETSPICSFSSFVFPKRTTESITSLRRLYSIGATDTHSWYCDNSLGVTQRRYGVPLMWYHEYADRVRRWII